MKRATKKDIKGLNDGMLRKVVGVGGAPGFRGVGLKLDDGSRVILNERQLDAITKVLEEANPGMFKSNLS